METIAVYWESQIRIYGMSAQPDLVLFTIIFPAENSVFFSSQLESLGSAIKRFYFVTTQITQDNKLQFSVLVHQHNRDDVLHILNSAAEDEMSFSSQEDVGLISLHGPHFQDRYGIADAACSLLDSHGVSILASSYTGTSINLVVPELVLQDTLQCLQELFIVPSGDD